MSPQITSLASNRSPRDLLQLIVVILLVSPVVVYQILLVPHLHYISWSFEPAFQTPFITSHPLVIHSIPYALRVPNFLLSYSPLFNREGSLPPAACSPQYLCMLIDCTSFRHSPLGHRYALLLCNHPPGGLLVSTSGFLIVQQQRLWLANSN